MIPGGNGDHRLPTELIAQARAGERGSEDRGITERSGSHSPIKPDSSPSLICMCMANACHFVSVVSS